MYGSALLRWVQKENPSAEIITARSKEVDLRDPAQVKEFFAHTKPQYVILAAARVGGIQANREKPTEFLCDNVVIQNNVFRYSREYGVKKLLFLGSSCIYPRECPQPMKEEYLLTGPLEPTNEGYALAKIVGLKTARYMYDQYGFQSVCVMPCNLYGTNDSFDPLHSHVLSALVKKFVDARDSDLKEVTMWGTGSARREFMHVEDAARISLSLFQTQSSPDIINIGSGSDVSIKELAVLVAEIVGYTGTMLWDPSKPDGMPRKCLDVSKMNSFGLKTTISLEEGVRGVVSDYIDLKGKNKS